MFKKYFRLLNTIKYLKPSQLFYYLLRRNLPANKVTVSVAPVLRDGLDLVRPISIEGVIHNEKYFSFLNLTRQLSIDSFDWSPENVPRLWRYNLHYFDYLREENLSDQYKYSLTKDWVMGNPQNSIPGWEPFTTSLRIVNWIFYFSAIQPRDSTVVNSLYEQTLWLEKNDERFILANHYFENMKALVFAGCFFSGADAERWRKKGTQELVKQLVEQTLSDGGHYERSPQYHVLMLENYLDLYNLAKIILIYLIKALFCYYKILYLKI